MISKLNVRGLWNLTNFWLVHQSVCLTAWEWYTYMYFWESRQWFVQLLRWRAHDYLLLTALSPSLAKPALGLCRRSNPQQNGLPRNPFLPRKRSVLEIMFAVNNCDYCPPKVRHWWKQRYGLSRLRNWGGFSITLPTFCECVLWMCVLEMAINLWRQVSSIFHDQV